MTWIPGTGELGTRLARALGVRGRISTELDETVIAQVLLSDAPNNPPYRSDGRFAWAGGDRTGLVGPPITIPGLFVFNESGSDQVITAVWVELSAAGIALITYTGSESGDVLTLNSQFVTSEGQIRGSNTVQFVPLRLRGTTTATVTGSTIWSQTVVANTPVYVPLDFVLPAGHQLAIFGPQAVQTVRASVQAQIFRHPVP